MECRQTLNEENCIFIKEESTDNGADDENGQTQTVNEENFIFIKEESTDHGADDENEQMLNEENCIFIKEESILDGAYDTNGSNFKFIEEESADDKNELDLPFFHSEINIDENEVIDNDNEIHLLMAKNAVENTGMSIRKASRFYMVPYSTLRRRVVEQRMSNKRGRRPVLQNMEKEIVDAIIELSEAGFGPNPKDVLHMAYDVSLKLPETNKFANKYPSSMWLKRFRNRHKRGLRTVENISSARCDMSDESVKNAFFKKYAGLVKKLQLSAADIYNMDETGFQLVSCTNRNVTYGERSETITAACCANANGNVIVPPMLIFKGKSSNDDITLSNAPAETLFASSEKGYIVTELFEKWFRGFLKKIPVKRPVLLILDNHTSHVNINVIREAKANGVHLLCCPEHSSQHVYQPLDSVVFKELKSEFKKKVVAKQTQKKRRILKRTDFVDIFNEIWYETFTPEHICAGFERTGMWPVNPDAASTKLSNRMPAKTASTSDESKISASDEPENSPAVVEVIEDTSKKGSPGGCNEEIISGKITNTRILASVEYFEEGDNEETGRNLKRRKNTNDFKNIDKRSEANNTSNKKSKKKEYNLVGKVETNINGSADEYGSNIMPEVNNFERNEIDVGKFLVIKLVYQGRRNKEKIFIAEIVKIENESIECSFLRKSEKIINAFFYPKVVDIMNINYENILQCLGQASSVRRGYYKFDKLTRAYNFS